MIIKFDNLDKNKVLNMRNGEGFVYIQKHNSDGKMIAKITIPPLSSIGYHTHTDDDEVVYVLKGTGTCIMGNERVTLVAGDINYTPKNNSHSIINDSDKDLEILAVITKLN
mgnify:CR=1 FL=1